MSGPERDRSLQYLNHFFGPFGTYTSPGTSSATSAEFWKDCIVRGIPELPKVAKVSHLDPAPFEQLLDVLGDDRLITSLTLDPQIETAVRRVHTALAETSPSSSLATIAAEAIAAATARLVTACAEINNPSSLRPTSLDVLADRLFGSSEPRHQRALRGLLILRGLGDRATALFGSRRQDTLASFRLHAFLRSLEGLFATPRIEGELDLMVLRLNVARLIPRPISAIIDARSS